MSSACCHTNPLRAIPALFRLTILAKSQSCFEERCRGSTGAFGVAGERPPTHRQCSFRTFQGPCSLRPGLGKVCLNAKSRRSTRCCEKLNSALRLIQRTTSEAPQRPDEGNFRCHLRIVSGLAENTNSIFCDSSLELEAANGCPVLQGAGTTSRGRIFSSIEVDHSG